MARIRQELPSGGLQRGENDDSRHHFESRRQRRRAGARIFKFLLATLPVCTGLSGAFRNRLAQAVRRGAFPRAQRVPNLPPHNRGRGTIGEVSNSCSPVSELRH